MKNSILYALSTKYYSLQFSIFFTHTLSLILHDKEYYYCHTSNDNHLPTLTTILRTSIT